MITDTQRLPSGVVYNDTEKVQPMRPLKIVLKVDLDQFGKDIVEVQSLDTSLYLCGFFSRSKTIPYEYVGPS